MSILQELLAEAEGSSPEELLKVIEAAQVKMNEVDKALDEVTKLTSKLPGLFRTHIYAGRLNNLETPKEYSIWVGVENVKSLYSLSKEFSETQRGFEQLKKQLKAYKK